MLPADNLPSPREVLSRLPAHFRPEAAGDARATVQLELTGQQGGQWTLLVADGRCNLLDGHQGVPHLWISALAEDYVGLLTGTLTPMNALMQGRIKMRGDISLAMRMQSWFRRPEGL